jgi:hypothetical protein
MGRFAKFIVGCGVIWAIAMVIMTVSSDPECLKKTGGSAAMCSTFGSKMVTDQIQKSEEITQKNFPGTKF